MTATDTIIIYNTFTIAGILIHPTNHYNYNYNTMP